MADTTDRGAIPPPAEARRASILIIEDDPGVARLERLHLQRAGFEVAVANTADRAGELIEQGEFDLFVLDQNLQGGVSGLDLYERLRAEGVRTPAILVTGLSDEATLIRAMRGGLNDFVLKTADFFDDLIQAVERVVAQAQTRRKLVESEARLAGVTLLAEAIPQVVWSAQPDGQLDYFNRRWSLYTGLDPEDGVGSAWSRVVHPDDLDRVADRWREAIQSGEIYQVEFRMRRGSDGAYRWFLARGELVQDDAGQVRKWFGTWTDIDDQKRAEQELQHANELAESASRSKDQFLAMLSHELRTPLTPVLLIATASRDDPSTPGHLRPTFELIRQNLELEARLIDDLLDVMRIIRGKLPYQFEVVDAHAQINRAIEICRNESEAKELRLVADFQATDHHVRADAARLQQVLWNLIKNAVKFTPWGGLITIQTRNHPAGVEIDVADDGIGIDPALLPLIFNAFEQGEDSITKRFGGLGLGLAISRSIVEGHQGRLTVSSPGRDQGATFSLQLPVTTPTLDLAPAPGLGDGSAPGPAPLPVAEPPHADCQVLLVEDDAMTARIMAKLLRQNGYLVTTANSVASALGVADDEYNLIVSDIGLPDGTGLDLMRAIKLRRDVPAIALTGYGMEGDVRNSLEAGFVAHLTKPVDFAKLDQMIRQVAARTAPV